MSEPWFSASFSTSGPWHNPPFSDPALIDAARPLSDGSPRAFHTVPGATEAGFQGYLTRGLANEIWARILRRSVNGHVPRVGVSHKGAASADELFVFRSVKPRNYRRRAVRVDDRPQTAAMSSESRYA